jgi:hypothetical protein
MSGRLRMDGSERTCKEENEKNHERFLTTFFHFSDRGSDRTSRIRIPSSVQRIATFGLWKV